MKTFVRTFRGKISYKKIDKYIDLVRRTLDPDDYFATDNGLGDYISLMADVVEGDIDPQIEFDVESDEHHRYVIVNILDKALH